MCVYLSGRQRIHGESLTSEHSLVNPHLRNLRGFQQKGKEGKSRHSSRRQQSRAPACRQHVLDASLLRFKGQGAAKKDEKNF